MKKWNFICCLATLVLFMMSSCSDSIKPVNLRTDYLVNPIGLDNQTPQFTWEYSSQKKDVTISRTEVYVGSSPEKLAKYQAGMKFDSYTKYYWIVKAWDSKGHECAKSDTATFEMGKTQPSEWNGQWISDNHEKEFGPAPLFRKTFKLDKQASKARAYVAVAGYYKLYINGKQVQDSYLDPGYTAFDKRILTVTYDITPLLKQGDNVVAAELGNGWYNEQSVATWNFDKAAWRNRPNMQMELRIQLSDNAVNSIKTDSTWLTSTGASLYNNIYSGERYDARLEQKGWNNLPFDDSKWEKVKVVASPTAQLVAREMQPIRVKEELKPASVKTFSDKLYVFSFPKNISGVCRLKVKGAAGTKITMKHGELLKPDGRLEQGNINVYFTPVDKNEIFQTDEYTLRGDGTDEIFVPSFTYHGFQYVEVESSEPVALTKESLTALFFHTDVEPVGSFSCSNPMLNKIWAASIQSYLCNLESIPTDCPQREKNGWTADAHVSTDLGLLGFNGINFYQKWMNDFIDNQKVNGQISGIIPSAGWGYEDWIGPVWDAALFIIPDKLYQYYGDTSTIRRLYSTMTEYLYYLQTREETGFLNYGIGDWLTYKATTNTQYTSTAFYYYDNVLMSRFSKILGKDTLPFSRKAEGLRQLINVKFYHPESGFYADSTQAAQAVALYLGLVNPSQEKRVAENLHKIVKANNYFLDFGLLGSKMVPAMLVKYGYMDDAMKMVLKKEAPSWGYWVETLGLTTLSETWVLNKDLHDGSLNHVFLGDISAWMMNQLAGINYDSDSPGFKHFKLTPHFVSELDWAKGSYRSVRGLIRSEWKRENGTVKLTVEVPAGCTADLTVNNKTSHIGSGISTFTYKF